MAEGVANAVIVCCFLTPDYQISPDCQRELKHAADLETEYAKKKELGKLRMIPCMIVDKKNPKWKPSDWLANIIAGKLQIRMKDDSDSSIELLAKELIRRIKNEPLKPMIQETPSPAHLFKTIQQKYLRDNQIKRMVNEEKSFPIEQSYINLTIVETKEQLEKEKKLKQQVQENQPEHEHDQNCRSKQHNHEILGSYEEIYGTKTSIDVTKIFEKCKDQTNKVLILGRAGIGKSTFCQYVTYRWAKGELWSQYDLIILIRLRKLTDSRYPSGTKYSLIHLLEKEYFPCEDLSKEQIQHFKKLCNKCQVLWILDGYDEFAQNIPVQLKDVFNHVRETQHHILTSRPYAIALSYDVKMEIIGFKDDNITQYIEQFFEQITRDMADATIQGLKLLQFLKSNPNIWGVAHIPVNLELICSLWSNNNWSETKILTMTALYDNITEWLCRRHLKRQNINDEAMTKQIVYKKCDADLQFLEHLAFKAMESNKIILSPALLEETENETECSLFDHPQLLNIGILKSYDDKSIGNQNQTRKHHYFVHLSFQEHFAARHLLRALKNSKDDTAKHLINDNKYKQHFQLVFIFASGLLAQSYYKSCMVQFWAIIQGEPLDLVGLNHTKLFIQCIDELQKQTIFRECCHYLNAISQWFDICLTEPASIITNYLLQSFQRTTILLNTTIIQNKLLQLIATANTVTKHKIFGIISQLTVTEPVPKLLSAISDALRDEDADVRKNACKALGNIGEKAVTTDVIAGLMNALRDEDSNVRRYACKAFSNIGEKAATPEVIVGLINAFGDKDQKVRHNAYEAFEKIGEKATTNDVITNLINTLRDKDWKVREDAREALGKISEKAATTDVITGLINALRHADSYVRENACEALCKIGEQAAKTDVIIGLINAVRDETWQIKQYTMDVLVQIGEKTATTDVITSLINALRHLDSYIRENACEVLGKIGEKAATTDVITGLINALQDEDSKVRENACEAFAKIGEKAATTDVITGLINALRDEDSCVRANACWALGTMGENAVTTEVIAVLINALQDEDYVVKHNVCHVFGNIGEKAATTDVITGLINAFRDKDWDVGRNAREALGKISEKAATTDVIIGLVNALRDADSSVRANACEAFLLIGEKAVTTDVIAGLIKALRDENWYVKQKTCWVLGKLGEIIATTDVIDGLIKALRDENSSVRKNACETLGKIGEKAVTTDVIIGLINALRDEDSEVRENACEAFEKIGEKAATTDVIIGLINALRDKASKVRANACWALGKMGKKAATTEVIAVLINALRDEKSYVRYKACKALGSIGEKTATTDVIAGLINAFSEDIFDKDDEEYVAQAFKRVICSYSAIKQLDSDMVSKLYSCLRQLLCLELAAVPRDQWIKVFLETRNGAWLPLVRYAALLQAIAITIVDNRIIIYDIEQISEFVVEPELMDSFLKFFRSYPAEING